MAPVVVHVYDLSEHNNWMLCGGLGIFHSGVEVYGSEYAFGAHDLDSPGVFATLPRQAPGGATWRCSIPLGETRFSAKAVHQIVSNMGQHYWGSRYHLLQNNCNHFSSDLCYELTGRRPAGWINRLAGVVVGLHCLIPVDWLPPLETPSAPPSFAVTESPRALAQQIDESRRAHQYATTSEHHGAPDTQRLLGSSATSSFARMDEMITKQSQ